MHNREPDPQWQNQPTGRLMILAFRRFEEVVMANLHKIGYTDLNMSHLNVIRHLDPDGLNLVDLAKDAAISKQAISKIAADLDKKGYVTMARDPHDGRAKRVLFTRKGQAAVTSAINIVKDIEKQYLALVGPSAYHDMRETLATMIHLTQAEAD